MAGPTVVMMHVQAACRFKQRDAGHTCDPGVRHVCPSGIAADVDAQQYCLGLGSCVMVLPVPSVSSHLLGAGVTGLAAEMMRTRPGFFEH
jgi:hypothetical protein